MSYLRGDYYFWVDATDHIHLWARHGYDGWDDSGWATPRKGTASSTRQTDDSGVAIPCSVMDSFVVMRFAELLESGLVGSAIDRTLSPGNGGGNCGGAALTRQAGALRRVQASLQEAADGTKDSENV